MVKLEKCELGVDILQAIIQKYFKDDIPKDFKA